MNLILSYEIKKVIIIKIKKKDAFLCLFESFACLSCCRVATFNIHKDVKLLMSWYHRRSVLWASTHSCSIISACGCCRRLASAASSSRPFSSNSEFSMVLLVESWYSGGLPSLILITSCSHWGSNMVRMMNVFHSCCLRCSNFRASNFRTCPVLLVRWPREGFFGGSFREEDL